MYQVQANLNLYNKKHNCPNKINNNNGHNFKHKNSNI